MQEGLFGPGALPVSTWHRHEAVAAEGAGDWGTAAFHWHNLAKLHPGSLEVAQRLEYSEACAAWASKAGPSYPEQRHSIPPRDPRASPRQIDLTEHYNGRITHDYAVFHRGTGLRLGLQELDGITFDVRGQIDLFGAKAAARGYILPEKVTGIAIRRRAARVHLLHTAGWANGPADTRGESELASVIVRFTQGDSERLSIRNGVHVASGWSRSGNRPTKARLAWAGAGNTIDQHSALSLYHYSWPNPRPELEIAEIDLVSSRSDASYKLLAITLE